MILKRWLLLHIHNRSLHVKSMVTLSLQYCILGHFRYQCRRMWFYRFIYFRDISRGFWRILSSRRLLQLSLRSHVICQI